MQIFSAVSGIVAWGIAMTLRIRLQITFNMSAISNYLVWLPMAW